MTRDKRRRTWLLFWSLIGTFVVVRIFLWLSPNTDLNVGRYNIHHLFTGLLLVAAGGIPLVVCRTDTRVTDFAVVAFGVGLSLALDEWVYLIATDGSNAAYWLPVSFWGAVVMIGLAALYVLLIHLRWR